MRETTEPNLQHDLAIHSKDWNGVEKWYEHFFDKDGHHTRTITYMKADCPEAYRIPLS